MPNPLAGVASWAYVISNVGPDRMAEIGALPVDLVVVDSENRRLEPFSPADVARLRGPSDKLVVSYLSIGEAETYRDYWQAAWEADPPGWLAAENPEWEGNITVAFWKPAWQEIVLGMVDAIVDAGFNGLYLDIVDAYAWWEEERPRADRHFYRDAMVDFVAAIRARAEARLAEGGDPGRAFAIIGQNGEDLARDPDYLAAVDGIGKEDLHFYYPNGAPASFGPVPKGWLTGSRALLERAEAAGVETLVVEYVPPRFRDRVIGEIRDEIAWLGGIGAPLYLCTSRALDRVELSIDANGWVRHWGGPGGARLEGTPWRDLFAAGAGDDTLIGGRGRDRLEAGDGADLLRGGAGGDVLIAGPGDDAARGGAGADRFVFAPGDGRLAVEDFGLGADRIDLRGFGLADFAALGAEIGARRVVIDLAGEVVLLRGPGAAEFDAGDVLL